MDGRLRDAMGIGRIAWGGAWIWSGGNEFCFRRNELKRKRTLKKKKKVLCAFNTLRLHFSEESGQTWWLLSSPHGRMSPQQVNEALKEMAWSTES